MAPLSYTRLNTICPYYTMYPLDFPFRVLRRSARQGQWVLDPFCGRGTTNFAARLLGLNTVGIDSSPIAIAISAAKLAQVTSEEVVSAASAIVSACGQPSDVPDDDFWHWAYHKDTLLDVCRLRAAVRENPSTATNIMLRAIVLGVLHGPRNKGQPSYLSNQAPRTFAPKPTYSVRFWKTLGLYPQHVDVLDVIRRRAQYCLAQLPVIVDGYVLFGDSRKVDNYPTKRKFSWVITSPPYYGMRTYIADQWLRNWFVGGPPHVPYSQSDREIRHASPETFASQLRDVWKHAARTSLPHARLVCRFGGINDRKAEPLELIRESLRDSGWRLLTARFAGTAFDGRRQALQFGERARAQPPREYDVYAALN